MPQAIPIAVAAAPALIKAGGDIFGATKQSQSADKAAAAQKEATDRAYNYQVSQDKLAEQHRQEDRAQQIAAWNAEQERKAPARAAAASIWRKLGINMPDTAAVMPPGYGTTAASGEASTQTGQPTLLDVYGGAQAAPTAAPAAALPAQNPQLTLEDWLGNYKRPTTIGNA